MCLHSLICRYLTELLPPAGQDEWQTNISTVKQEQYNRNIAILNQFREAVLTQKQHTLKIRGINTHSPDNSLTLFAESLPH